jgi:hypothetical protein
MRTRRHPLRFVRSVVASLTALALVLVALTLRPSVAVAAPSPTVAAVVSAGASLGRAVVTVTTPSPVVSSAQAPLPLQEVLRGLLQVAGDRVVQSMRDAAPGLMQRIDSLLDARRAARADESGAQRTGRAVLQVAGVSLVGLVIAFAVLITVLGPLEGIIKTVEADVSGAFWRGLLAQVITLPVLSLLVLALALTFVGLLLVPIVAVAFSLALAGIATLAMIAVACVIGRVRASDERGRSRAGLLRAMLTGYAIIWAPWYLAAALVSVPGVGLLTRLIALASSWGIVTVGIGATLRSRGGKVIPDAVTPALVGGAPAPAPDWSTPTPVTGVVAAQRPAQP